MDDPRLSLSDMGFPMPFSVLTTVFDIMGEHYPTSKQGTKTMTF